MLFDRVIANPPFSLKNWGFEEAQNDGFGRFRYGIPPQTKGDFAFVEHMISTLNQDGKMGVVVPHGVLFRGGAEGRIRESIWKEDIIEAIVGLPSTLLRHGHTRSHNNSKQEQAAGEAGLYPVH